MEIVKPTNKPILSGINIPIDISKAIDIIRNEKTSSSVPFRPHAGELYLFTPSAPIHKDDWRADGFNWINAGVRSQPKRDPKLKKAFFHAKVGRVGGDDISNKGFRREAYWLLHEQVKEYFIYCKSYN